jgi:hypothetical protein
MEVTYTGQSITKLPLTLTATWHIITTLHVAQSFR